MNNITFTIATLIDFVDKNPGRTIVRLNNINVRIITTSDANAIELIVRNKKGQELVCHVTARDDVVILVNELHSILTSSDSYSTNNSYSKDDLITGLADLINQIR